MATLGIDLFAGAGGLSLGASRAGVRVTHAVENNASAAATYRLNHPDTDLIEQDICQVHPTTREWGHPTVLFGGPPCQGFSTSNQRTRSVNNPKNWLFTQFVRCTGALKPEWVILENVRGLRETAQGRFERQILSGLEGLGYNTALWVLSATGFGVPQRRSRLFFVGRRKGALPAPPEPSISSPTTVAEAIEDLPSLCCGASVDELPYANKPKSPFGKQMRGALTSCTGHLVTGNNALVRERYRHIPQGGNWCDIPARLMRNYSNLIDRRSRHTGIYHRLKWHEPSVVIANYRKNMLIHPRQHRGLSVREAARLQSFPDWYRFIGSIGFQQQQVSNAVPVLLAEAVFRTILSA